MQEETMGRFLARKVATGALTALCLVICSCSTKNDSSAPGQSTSASSQAFSADNVLSDDELTDSSALTADQIQAFLENNYCNTRSYLADYSSNGKSAAQLIYDAAVANHINPIELLVRIQMESSLICYGSATATQIT
jgi:hypothetical protein